MKVSGTEGVATFETLRALVLHHAARRGWMTQRHIAVACSLDESAVSRFLSGEQDIGARRTHALFQAVGVPVAHYDLAYALLGRVQDLAGMNRAARRARRAAGIPDTTRRDGAGRGDPGRSLSYFSARIASNVAGLCQEGGRPAASRPVRAAIADVDVPAAVVIALFQAEGYTGAEIAAFFAGRVLDRPA